MATASNITPSVPQQPDLRAFIVCDRLPEGCVAYPVRNNDHAPHLRAGEWVIVDPTDCTPTHRDLFVIQWQGGSGPQVVEAAWFDQARDYWMVGVRRSRFNRGSTLPVSDGILCGDFPYRTGQLEQRFLGRVVGILEQEFTEPLRLTVIGGGHA